MGRRVSADLDEIGEFVRALVKEEVAKLLFGGDEAELEAIKHGKTAPSARVTVSLPEEMYDELKALPGKTSVHVQKAMRMYLRAKRRARDE